MSILYTFQFYCFFFFKETDPNGGTLYFGDNERGHVISHIFTVHDSLARGFQRKYCIVMLMRDKIHLLNCWPFLTEHIKKISSEMQEKSLKVNNLEQMHKSQRAVRQAQASPVCNGRSLGQLTGKFVKKCEVKCYLIKFR